jgi:hypothetical protein
MREEDFYKDALYGALEDKVRNMSLIQLFTYICKYSTVTEVFALILTIIKKGQFLDSVQSYALEIAKDIHPEDTLND